jgi:hypothetical protein
MTMGTGAVTENEAEHVCLLTGGLTLLALAFSALMRRYRW